MKTFSVLIFLWLSFSASAQEESPVPGSSASAPSEKTSAYFENIRLFPNPTSEIIFIRHGELIDSYRLLDMQGQVLQEGIGNAQVISLVDVPVGYYFLEMTVDGQQKQVKIQKY